MRLLDGIARLFIWRFRAPGWGRIDAHAIVPLKQKKQDNPVK
jgi:hypothetical protein